MEIPLIEQNGMLYVGSRLLLKVGEDVETFNRNSPVEKIVGALYDLHQTHDEWENGVEFTLDGKVIARVRGIHVARV